LTLRMTDCCYRVGDHVLLENVSATISSGVVTGILGANGAGKTSLVHVATGAEKAHEGSISLSGPAGELPLEKLSHLARARQIAVLPQTATLEFPFSVEEVVLMSRIPHLSDDITNRALVAQVLNMFSLNELAHRTYTSLSGGEKQRVQICRVICQVFDQVENAHLIFDEPIAPLDIAHQVAFFRLIRKLAFEGAAIGLVLHDIELACQFCDELILMSHGKVICAGKPKDVITTDSIQSAFDVAVTVVEGPKGALRLVFDD
jgi:iron complex transport system ATP-binding protein